MTVSRVSALAQISKCPAPANATPRESSKLSENALYRQRLDESVVRVLAVLLKAKDTTVGKTPASTPRSTVLWRERLVARASSC